MRQPSLCKIATLGAAIVCSSVLFGCSSSGTWRPVPVSIIPAAPAPHPPGRGPRGGGLKPAAPPPKTDDDEKSQAPAATPPTAVVLARIGDGAR